MRVNLRKLRVNLRKICGPWNGGWVLDKHTLSSSRVGDQYGHPRFDTTRTEVGEAVYKLKYKCRWEYAKLLAQALSEHIFPELDNVGFIIPMPASKCRERQPVTEVANELGKIVDKPVHDLLVKAPNGRSLKDLKTKDEKIEAIGKSLSIKDEIANNGSWNVLLIDDLFDTGASMEVAHNVLREYAKVQKIYVAALSWK